MNKIEQILQEQGFTDIESEAFEKIINQAKLSQEAGVKTSLKTYINSLIEEVLKNEDKVDQIQ